MKDNSLDGHRGKVALSDTTKNLTQQQQQVLSSVTGGSNNSAGSSSKCELKAPSTGVSGSTSSNNDGTTTTNFDDDYNEWELGIGDLIIDLDADIANERNNATVCGTSNSTTGPGNAGGSPANHHIPHHLQNGSIGSSASSSASSLVSSVSNSSPTSSTASAFTFLATSQTTCNSGPTNTGQTTMSNSKSSRGNIGTANAGSNSGSTSSSGSSSACVVVGSGNSSSSNSSSSSSVGVGAAVEHQATVDKGLKMKIKRKTVGSKYSEAKHEIVQSDTKASVTSSISDNTTNSNNGNCMAGSGTGSNLNVGNTCSSNSNETPKSKHSSGKGRNSSHREKKEKNRDKDKNSSARNTSSVDMNGVLNVMSPSLKISSVSLSSPIPQTTIVGSSVPSPLTPNGTVTGTGSMTPRTTPGVTVGNNSGSATTNTVLQTVAGSSEPSPGQQSFPAATTQAISSSNSPPMPNLTLKIENKYSPSTPCSVLVKQEEMPGSPPLKRLKVEPTDKPVVEVEGDESPIPPEMKDTSTCTSVGTITEPDCLGPCEPGTSVMLEGIVWQETEGGVLVVNVTWRGKTYVGTLLDCTEHDWAPPRFCESPTSDVDNKATKGRGKRGRGANNATNEISAFDARNCVQSKLRNGKGRRTTINSSFTVPNSPAKSDSNSGPNTKRKGRPMDLEITATVTPDSKVSKRSRLQSRGTPTPGSSGSEFPQPSSPVLIECPEPNCSKKYKHINGLRYHQQHAHSSGSDGSSNNKIEDNTEDSKDVTNSSDNEESAQENISVPPSPAISFTNAVVSPLTSNGRNSQTDNVSSSNATSLPENDPYNLTPDLSTLASVAMNDLKSAQKTVNGNRVTPTMPSTMQGTGGSPQELPVIVSTEGTKNMPSVSVLQCASSCSSSVPASAPSSVISIGASSSDANSTMPLVATSTSVIHSSASDTSAVVTPAVTVSIPASHVVFNNQGIPSGISSVTTSTTHTATVSVSSQNSSHQPVHTSLSTVSATTYVPVASAITNVSPTSIITDKSKIRPQQQQPTDRLDKYKPKSPMAASAIRPIVPAPSPQLIALSTNMSSSHSGINQGGHNIVTTSLKPIQPKPTILGEPTTINPALESLKKEKSKHKKKNKDRDRKMNMPVPLTTTVKLSTLPSEECESIDANPYPNLEATGSRDSLPTSIPITGSSHMTSSLLPMEGKPSESSLDLSLADDNINENIQSPAYSDISDANDTAPVLESEVASVKEKEDKVGKSTPDAAQSPAANISAYGMYPYYSQPPYLLPSVSPQNSAPPPSSMMEKMDSNKKTDQDRIKENRPWSNPSGELVRDRPPVEGENVEKKQLRDNGTPNSNVPQSPAASNTPIQEYQMQQPYPYSYGYIQGYPYSVEPAYHMHLLESDPHYKQQYKQYIEEQQRLYKEQQQQQQHHQAQQLQQPSQHVQHHPQSQQQQQQHHHHHSHHQSKIHHSSAVKEERDRDRSSSREHKEKSSDKSNTAHAEQVPQHVNKIQHSSMSSLIQTTKDHEQREHQQQQDVRPPSLPTQSRNENPQYSSSSLKEKQNENHQILKENIELKSQMDDKNNVNRFEMAMIYERHREDMRRYYMYERYVEQHQKMEPGFHHHTHHHQTIHPHQLQSHGSSSLKSHKDEMPPAMGHSKQSHYSEGSRTSTVMSPAKTEHIKSSSSHPHSSSSPKGASTRDSMSSHSASKDYSTSGMRDPSIGKKDSSMKSSERSESSASSARDDKSKIEKIKVEKTEPEGQKPTMETTGPPPPPTNAYAYLHPSYLQPPPPHFPHIPFEPAHAVYRGGLNPMIMSTPSYGASPYVHSQLRYVPPGACELPAHSQTPSADQLVSKGIHPPGPPKALDLLHQVSQHYTTHKIHELQEHALMSPTPPTSTPNASVVTSTPSSSATINSNSSSNSSNNSNSASVKVSTSESSVSSAKVIDASGSRDSSRSPPTQRHLHTHHHTHVGVGYPIYDPYGVGLRKPCA